VRMALVAEATKTWIVADEACATHHSRAGPSSTRAGSSKRAPLQSA
jgi:hypothetical protein